MARSGTNVFIGRLFDVSELSEDAMTGLLSADHQDRWTRDMWHVAIMPDGSTLIY